MTLRLEATAGQLRDTRGAGVLCEPGRVRHAGLLLVAQRSAAPGAAPSPARHRARRCPLAPGWRAAALLPLTACECDWKAWLKTCYN